MSGPTSALYVDPAIPRFTRAEIVAEMAERFGSMTEATFRHWQELGLVASPRSRRFEKGKAGSAPAMWSYNDKEQFGAVLDLRQRHFKEVGKPVDLCWLGNYVVWSWSFWDGFVELDQARRALRTWVTPQLGGAKGRARSKVTVNKLARQAVNQVAAPGISRSIRKAMAANIAEDLWHDDLERLRTRVPELTKIVDPEGTGRRVGAPGASVDAADEIERIYLAHRGAQAVVWGTPPIPDAYWYVARQIMRDAWVGYTLELPRMRAQATNPEWFTADLDTQVARSSSSLLLILGEQLAGVSPGLNQ